MKINKKIIVIVVFIIIFILGLLLVKYFYGNSNKDDLVMVEDYLNSKYNMNLKIKDYDYYDNGDIGIMAGEHYIFTFKSIDGFDLNARLDYMSLEKKNLNHLILNITDTEKANKLKKYVEENCNLKCKVTECRKIEEENNNDYYNFKVELDNNSNYWIMGKIYDDFLENSESVNEVSTSTSLEKKYNLSSNHENFQNLLNDIKNMNL